MNSKSRSWIYLLLLLNLALQQAKAEELRVISLAPNLTEVMFAIGVGEKLIGVSSYTNYPEAAKKIPIIGGYLDLNLESLISLKPNLVLALIEQKRTLDNLKQLGIKTVFFDPNSLEGIAKGIQKIGRATEKTQAANKLTEQIRAKIKSTKQKYSLSNKPKVLLAVGGHYDSAGLSKLYVAGKNSLYNEILELVGAENVYKNSISAYSNFSLDGIYALNPDIIIDLFPNSSYSNEEILSAWSKLEGLNAIKNKRIYILEEEYLVRPGPRVTRTIERLANIIHGTTNNPTN